MWYSISVLVCSALQSGDVNARDVARGLQKILSSGFQPSDLQEYAQLALHSPEPALRELALQQIGRFLQVETLYKGMQYHSIMYPVVSSHAERVSIDLDEAS